MTRRKFCLVLVSCALAMFVGVIGCHHADGEFTWDTDTDGGLDIDSDTDTDTDSYYDWDTEAEPPRFGVVWGYTYYYDQIAVGTIVRAFGIESLYQQPTHSDENGRYEMILPVDTYELHAVYLGIDGDTVEAVITEGCKIQVDFETH